MDDKICYDGGASVGHRGFVKKTQRFRGKIKVASLPVPAGPNRKSCKKIFRPNLVNKKMDRKKGHHKLVPGDCRPEPIFFVNSVSQILSGMLYIIILH